MNLILARRGVPRQLSITFDDSGFSLIFQNGLSLPQSTERQCSSAI